MRIENAEIARLFRELADLLEIEGANPFRVRAYRTAASYGVLLTSRSCGAPGSRWNDSTWPTLGQ